ncbi:hypothetical protein Bxe_C0825 [Paraburkholderia xenovorans LB400]|uniref:Uncharacterized protein n=1 Tax=Paraburkholderia xenovorans (strain LB400) TaxID=266265 RepID=Q13GT2_PARXL|nr:hypothetical protein Bxe_C0825 [Paraburkholderia xenovorans LB400]
MLDVNFQPPIRRLMREAERRFRVGCCRPRLAKFGQEKPSGLIVPRMPGRLLFHRSRQPTGIVHSILAACPATTRRTKPLAR